MEPFGVSKSIVEPSGLLIEMSLKVLGGTWGCQVYKASEDLRGNMALGEIKGYFYIWAAFDELRTFFDWDKGWG